MKYLRFLEHVDNEFLGAGALIVARNTGRVLLGFRSAKENNPHVWGNQGGHVDVNERVTDGLRREVREETGYKGDIQFIQFPTGKFPDGQFMFYNFLGIVPEEFEPNPPKKWAWETEKWGWYEFDKLPKPMHAKMMKDINAVEPFVTNMIKQI